MPCFIVGIEMNQMGGKAPSMAFEIDMDATVPVKLMLKSSLKSPETGLDVPRTVSSVTTTLFPEFNFVTHIFKKTLASPTAIKVARRFLRQTRH